MEIINVICVVFPSGEIYWFEASQGQEFLEKLIQKWKDKNQWANNSDCTMGCIEIKMPREKYFNIQSTNSIDW